MGKSSNNLCLWRKHTMILSVKKKCYDTYSFMLAGGDMIWQMWRVRGQLLGSDLSLHHVGLGEQTQVIRLNGKCLPPLSHPTGSAVVFKYKGHMTGEDRVSGLRRQRTGPRELPGHWGIVRLLWQGRNGRDRDWGPAPAPRKKNSINHLFQLVLGNFPWDREDRPSEMMQYNQKGTQPSPFSAGDVTARRSPKHGCRGHTETHCDQESTHTHLRKQEGTDTTRREICWSHSGVSRTILCLMSSGGTGCEDDWNLKSTIFGGICHFSHKGGHWCIHL